MNFRLVIYVVYVGLGTVAAGRHDTYWLALFCTMILATALLTVGERVSEAIEQSAHDREDAP